MRKLLDAEGYFPTVFEDVPLDDGFLIREVQDETPILENNKRLMTLNDGYTPSRDMKRIASIPLLLVEKWRIEEGIDIFNKDHWEAVKRKLNDPDYRFLRTAPGRV